MLVIFQLISEHFHIAFLQLQDTHYLLYIYDRLRNQLVEINETRKPPPVSSLPLHTHAHYPSGSTPNNPFTLVVSGSGKGKSKTSTHSKGAKVEMLLLDNQSAGKGKKATKREIKAQVALCMAECLRRSRDVALRVYTKPEFHENDHVKFCGKKNLVPFWYNFHVSHSS